MAGVGWIDTLTSRANAASAPAPPPNLDLRRSAFLPLLGRPFRIAHNGHSVTAILHQVGDLQPTVRPGAEDQFSLIFTGPRPSFSQGIYVVSHPRRGRIPLFLVPVGQSGTTQHYQAIIDNRPFSQLA